MEAWAYIEYFNGVIDHIVGPFNSKAEVEDYIRSYESSDPRVRQEAKPYAEALEELREKRAFRKKS